VRDILSLRVNPKLDSKVRKKSTQAVAGGGFISAGNLLYYLLNLLINSEIFYFGFFFMTVNSMRRYSWFLFSVHFCVKEFSISSQVVMEALGRALNHFLASPWRDCTKSIMTTSNYSKFRLSTNALKFSVCLCVMLSSSRLNLGRCFR